MVKSPHKQRPPAKKQEPPAKKQETPAKMSHALRQMKFMQRRDGAAKTRVVNSQPDGAESAPADTGTMLPSREYFGRRSFGGFNPIMEEAYAAFYAPG